MRVVTTAQASRLLNVTPATLRVWQQRFNFPTGSSSFDGRRRFDADDVAALRTALESGHSIAQGVEVARRSVARPRGGRAETMLRQIAQ